MDFPKQLYQNDRLTLPEREIKYYNFMYARYKPDSLWKRGEDFPDFTQIKADQSFNWSAYSIPVWVRFNDSKVYLKDYGVVAHSVKSMLLEGKQYYTLTHKPVQSNYSHCEVSINFGTTDKTKKREIRMILKHNCIVKFQPYTKYKAYLKPYDIVKMKIHRIISKVPYFR